MLKDDAKDQISLFDIPAPEKPTVPPPASSPPARETEDRRQEQKKTASPGMGPAKHSPGIGATPRSIPKKGKTAVRPSQGPVPKGDVRLTANIREDLHLKLKIVSATRRTTIGELIEDLVDRYL